MEPERSIWPVQRESFHKPAAAHNGSVCALPADSARLGMASCRKVTRTQNIRFWRVPD